jgi:hypothetical protein
VLWFSPRHCKADTEFVVPSDNNLNGTSGGVLLLLFFVFCFFFIIIAIAISDGIVLVTLDWRTGGGTCRLARWCSGTSGCHTTLARRGRIRLLAALFYPP